MKKRRILALFLTLAMIISMLSNGLSALAVETDQDIAAADSLRLAFDTNSERDQDELKKNEHGRFIVEAAGPVEPVGTFDDGAEQVFHYSVSGPGMDLVTVDQYGNIAVKSNADIPEEGVTVTVSADVAYYNADDVLFYEGFESKDPTAKGELTAKSEYGRFQGNDWNTNGAGFPFTERPYLITDTNPVGGQASRTGRYGVTQLDKTITGSQAPYTRLEEEQAGTFVFWYYDTFPSETVTSDDHWGAGIPNRGAMVDSDTNGANPARHYFAGVLGFNGNYGYRANGGDGAYGQWKELTTNGARSKGWHRFEFRVDADTGMTLWIDGQPTDYTDANKKTIAAVALGANFAATSANIRGRHFIDDMYVLKTGAQATETTLSKTITLKPGGTIVVDPVDPTKNITPECVSWEAPNQWDSNNAGGNAVNGNYSNRWACKSANGKDKQILTIRFAKARTVNKMGLNAYADRISVFSVEYLNDEGQWATAYSHNAVVPGRTSGASASNSAQFTFPPVKSTQFRLNLSQNPTADPSVWQWELYEAAQGPYLFSAAAREAVPSQGGAVTLDLTGQELMGTQVKALVADGEFTADVTGDTAANVTVTLPANTSERDKTYRVAFTIDGNASSLSVNLKVPAGKEATKKLWLQYDSPAPADGINGYGSSSTGYRNWQNWTLPIGNGYQGANVYGFVDRELMQISEESLWTGGFSSEYSDAAAIGLKGRDGNDITSAQAYQGARDAALGKAGATTPPNNQTINDFLKTLFPARTSGTNLGRVALGNYQSFAEVFYDFKHEGKTITAAETEDYLRWLDLENSVTGTSYSYEGVSYSRESFASYPDRVIVTRISADQDGKVNFTLNPTIPHAFSKKDMSITADETAKTIDLKGALTQNDLRFAAKFKVITDGTVTAGELDGNGTLTVANAKEAVVIMSLGTDYLNDYDKRYRTGEDPMGAVAERLDAAVAKGYEALRADHIADYQEIFGRVSLDLGGTATNMNTDALLSAYRANKTITEKRPGNLNFLEELYFQYGRYLLISSSREGTLPANLQGVWNRESAPSWQSDYHLNINLQMNYWPANNTNMEETLYALVDYMDSLRQPGRKVASSIYGVGDGTSESGWVAHVSSNPFGFTGLFDWHESDTAAGHAQYSPESAMWMMQNIYNMYQYYPDEAYLRDRIYPIMREAALFYSDEEILVYDPASGRMVMSPTYSSEQGPMWGGDTFQQQLLWQLFTDVIEASEILGLDGEAGGLRERLNTLLPKLSAEGDDVPVPIGPTNGKTLDGANAPGVKEWWWETSYYTTAAGAVPGTESGHRHLSHLVGLFPGSIITKDTPELMEAAVGSLIRRGDAATGWSRGMKTNLWARTGDGNHAYKIFNGLISDATLNNLWDYHTGPFFQIDGNLGGTAGMVEMLMQSHAGYIEPLPALPDAWPDGAVTGVTMRGGFTADMTWENKLVTSLKITSTAGGDCSVKYLDGDGQPFKVTVTQAGAPVNVTYDGGAATFATTKDAAYEVVFGSDQSTTYTVSGTVNGASGPLAGAAVRLTTDSAGENVYAAAMTDAAGMYSFTGVEPGGYYLFVTAEGYCRQGPLDITVTDGGVTRDVTMLADTGEKIDPSRPVEVRERDAAASRTAQGVGDTENAVDFTSLGGAFAAGDYLAYRNVDFAGGSYEKLMLVLSSDGANAGKKIELRLDTPTGQKIGEVTLSDTNGAQTFKEHYANLEHVSGVHDLYLAFPAAADVDMDFFVLTAYHFDLYEGTDPDDGDSYNYLFERVWETEEDRDEHMKWFRDAGFGMFIHFGAYSALGGRTLTPDQPGNPTGDKYSPVGTYVPKYVQNTSQAEWIMKNPNRIDKDIYREYAAAELNPVDFDAEAVVKLAQDAGQKYLVITTRHHEGFSMYDTQIRGHKDYKITTVSGHGTFDRDIVRELSDACKETQGTDKEVRFCAYVTLPDWYDDSQYPSFGDDNGSGLGGGKTGSFVNNFQGADEAAKNASRDEYLARLKGQLRELIVDYGAELIWFDNANMIKLTHEQSYDIYNYIRSLNPDVLINNRLFTYRSTSAASSVKVNLDFMTPEQSTLSQKPKDDFESCMTLNGKWGYSNTDQNWKSPTQVINLLMQCVGLGGNLLLNIGPDGSGNVPEKSQEILREVGRWMRPVSDSIYGTRSAFYELSELPAGVYATAKNGKLFFHLMSAYSGNTFMVAAPENAVKSAKVLNTGKPIEVINVSGKLFFDLNGLMRDQYDTVIEMEVEGYPTASSGTPEEPMVDIARAMFAAGKLTVEGSPAFISSTGGDYKLENIFSGTTGDNIVGDYYGAASSVKDGMYANLTFSEAVTVNKAVLHVRQASNKNQKIYNIEIQWWNPALSDNAGGWETVGLSESAAARPDRQAAEINFTQTVTTDKIRLWLPGASEPSIRELELYDDSGMAGKFAITSPEGKIDKGNFTVSGTCSATAEKVELRLTGEGIETVTLAAALSGKTWSVNVDTSSWPQSVELSLLAMQKQGDEVLALDTRQVTYGKWENLALGKTVTTSTKFNDSYGGDKLTDGITAVSTNRWASLSDDATPWFIIDLGETRSINRMVMYEWTGGSPRAQKFLIECSPDAEGDTWTSVYEGTEIGTKGISAFEPTEARRVRVTMLKYPDPTQQPTLQEAEVYGGMPTYWTELSTAIYRAAAGYGKTEEDLSGAGYTPASTGAYLTALRAAEDVEAGGTATQAEINKAVKDLQDAIAGLVKNGDVPAPEYSVEIKADQTSVRSGEVVTVTVTARGGQFVGAACKLTYETDKFEAVNVPDGWESKGENSYNYYNVIDKGFYPEDTVLGTFTFKARSQTSGTGTFSLTNVYVVGEWEEGWSEDAALELPDSSIDVNITSAPVYVVEIVNDYVAGCSLVLVYTDDKADAYTYAYDGKPMYDVTSAGYLYQGIKYAHVYGMVTKTASADKIAAVEGGSAVKLIYTTDVNGSGETDLNDAVAVVAVYNANELYLDAIHMDIVLKADVNKDKKVNVDDFGLIKAKYMAENPVLGFSGTGRASRIQVTRFTL